MEAKLLTAERFVDMRTEISYRYVYSETEYFRPHYHDYCEVFLVLEGQARHLVGQSIELLRPRDLVFIRPSDTHDYVSLDGSGFAMLNITFTVDTLRQLFGFLGEGFPAGALLEAPLPPAVHLTAGELEGIHARMAAVGAIAQEDTGALKTALRVLLFELFTRYFSNYTADRRAVPEWLETLCTQVRTTGSFVEGSEKLFALTNRSREHVCRSMKKYMGVTVSEFINELRLRYIASMLRSSNRTVAEIVFASGFNNLSWAATLFKEKYGMTMGKFRKWSNT